jgi:hypothetical protein
MMMGKELFLRYVLHAYPIFAELDDYIKYLKLSKLLYQT